MYTLDLKISGITCDACIKLIKKKVGRITGVVSVEVVKSGEANVMSQTEIKPEDISLVLSGTPYTVVA